MRFKSLTLTRFGALENRKFDFPLRNGIDIHIIYGRNEAGKSITTGAMVDFMFGIPERTTMGFRFPSNTLELAGAIEHGSVSVNLIRYKRRKTPLTDASGVAFSDAQLAEFVGAINSDIFKRAWCLNHARMVSGGTEILQAKDDASRMIFQAAAGLDGIEQLTEAYRGEADRLWSSRRSGERAYWIAESQLKQAEDDLKAALVRGKAWNEAMTAQANAGEALEGAREALAENERRRTMLERVRRVAPHLQKLRQVSRQLHELAQAPLLPDDAEHVLREAEQKLAGAAQDLRNEAARLDAAERDMQAALLDPPVLTLEREIKALGAQRDGVARHAADVIKREQEAAAHEAEALRDATRLRLVISDIAALRGALPGGEVRSAVSAHAATFAGKASAVSTSRTTVEETTAKLVQLHKQLTDLPAVADSAPLAGAADGLRALGQIDDLRSQHESRKTKGELQLNEALRRLAPWSGTLDTLRDLVPFSSEEAATLLAQLRTVENDLRELRKRLLEAQCARDGAAAAADRALSQAGQIAPEQLQAARAAREGLWSSIKGGASLADNAADYEDSVEKADTIADQRFASAESVHALTAAREAAGKAVRTVEDLEVQTRNAQASHDETVARWAAIATAAGVPALPLASAGAWLAAHEAAFRAGGELDQAEADLKAFDRRVEQQASILRTALEAAGVAIPHPGMPRILLAAADTHVTRQRDTGAERTRLARAITDAEGAAQLAEKRSTAAQTDRADWDRGWTALLARAGLPADMTADSALAALETLNGIAAQLKSAQDLRTRADAMKEDLQAFASAAAHLRDQLGLPGELTPEAVAHAAAARLERAHDGKRQYDGARQRKLEADHAIDAASIRQAEARALLAPLLAASRCESADDLRNAIQVSARKRELQADVDASRKDILGAASGLSFETAEAEVDGVDMLAVDGEVLDLAEKQAQLQAEREKQVLAQSEAQQQLKNMQGGDAAALAEGRRQEAIASMAQAAERYIKLRIAARLLAWAVNKYREDRQDPLLKLAGARFATLTENSFTGLVIDYEDETPVIKGQRPGGELVGVEGLSEGTRDQLYLALRVAAIEQNLDKAHALPFIADDLFINFDEGRVESGFRALQPLAGRSQVIYFTHHRHVVEAARAVYGPDVNLIEL